MTFNAWTKPPMINRDHTGSAFEKMRRALSVPRLALSVIQQQEVEDAQVEAAQRFLKTPNVANNYLMAAVDSGATDHFMPTHFQGTNHCSVLDGIRVACANNSIMIARATDTLDMPGLPTSARDCHKFDEISTPLP